MICNSNGPLCLASHIAAWTVTLHQLLNARLDESTNQSVDHSLDRSFHPSALRSSNPASHSLITVSMFAVKYAMLH